MFKYLILLLLLPALLCALPAIAQTKVKPKVESKVEPLPLPCPVGMKKCETLRGNKEKYDRCMFLICSDPNRENLEKEEGLVTCDVGLRKCNSLRDEAVFYWGCMAETCKAPPENVDPSCPEGHKKCKVTLDEYWLCMNLACRNPLSSFETCPTGISTCSTTITTYWDCVSNACLGDVYKFRNPALYKKKTKGNDSSKPFYEEGLKGVHPKHSFPPKGVRQSDWHEAGYIPPSRRLIGTPSDQLECISKGTTIICRSQDMLDCICGDGTRPKQKAATK